MIRSKQALAPQAINATLVRCVIALLTAIVPTTLFFAWDVGRASFVVLALFGIALICLRRIDVTLETSEKLLFTSIALFFLVALLSYSFNDVSESEKSFRYVWERYSLLVLFIPLYLLFRDQRFDIESVLCLFAVAAIVAGTMGLYEHFVLGQHRATGTAQPIFLGTVSLGMVAIVLAGWPIMLKRGFVSATLLVLATTLGISAVILSGTRGAWIATPFVALLIGGYFLRDAPRLVRVVTVVVVLGLFAASYQIQLVKTRVDTMFSEISTLFTDEARDTPSDRKSTALRLDMFVKAWEIFLDNPVLGIGPGAFKTELARRSEYDESYSHLTSFSNPHNQYLTSLSTHGVAGLVAIVLVLAVPAVICIRRLRWRDERALLALGGLSLLTCYAIYGLTLAPFERKFQLVFYTFSLALVLGTLLASDATEDEPVGAR